jgi:transcriptional regulator with GAF, ATPase, and Fis domain
MADEDRITMDTFKIVTKAIAESEDLEIMAGHICQLLIATLQLKGSSLFLLNARTGELDRLASFGLSTQYLAKGPILAGKSVGSVVKGKPVIIRDVADDDRVQYPEAAAREGIATIVSVPIFFLRQVIGCLRLYHSERWDISETDVDTLHILAENIGLAMRYTRLLNVVRSLGEELRSLPGDLGICAEGAEGFAVL